MGLRDLVYKVYEKRLEQLLRDVPGPRHVGVILDGNRRWAKSVGARDGYRQGADRIDELLEWCSDAEVEVVTLWLLSTDNLSRPEDELEPLFRVIERPCRASRRRQDLAGAPRRLARPVARGHAAHPQAG